MKKMMILVILLMTQGLAFGQTPKQSLERNADFGKLLFKIELNKDTFLPYEPFLVKFKVLNQTDTPLVAESPQFLLDSRLIVVNPAGETIEITSLTTSQGRALPLPGAVSILQPSQFYEEDKMPEVNSKVFSEPGIYQIQFVLYGGRKPLRSNVVKITIETPQGLNKEAFDFLTKNGKDVWFGRVFVEKDSVELLKTFVARFGESSYGDYSILSLGKYYLYKGELYYSQTEFEKIKDSQNKIIAENAKNSLAEIEKRQLF